MPGKVQRNTLGARKCDVTKAQKKTIASKHTASKLHAQKTTTCTPTDRESQPRGGGIHSDVTLVIEPPASAQPRPVERDQANNIEAAMNNVVQEAQRRARTDEGKVEMRRMAHLLKRAASTILDNVGEDSDSSALDSDSEECDSSGSECGECSYCQGRSSSSDCSDSECDCSDCLLESECTLESDE